MLINWKGDNLLVVSPVDVSKYAKFDKLPPKEREREIKVIDVPVKPVTILYGWNEIEDSIWDLCRPHIVDKIDSGMIEELCREEKDEEGNKKFVGVSITDFKNRQGASFNPDKLVEVIRGCNSLVTLNKWLGVDSRDEIRFEIKKQIEKLSEPPKVDE